MSDCSYGVGQQFRLIVRPLATHDPYMTLLIAFAVLSILVSFICTILEAALLSLTPSYIAHQKATQPALYERLNELK